VPRKLAGFVFLKSGLDEGLSLCGSVLMEIPIVLARSFAAYDPSMRPMGRNGMPNSCVTSTLSRVTVGCVFAMAFATGFAQQKTTTAPQLKPVPMPQDRVADSYDIYSQLLPGNQIEWGNAPRSQWLVEDTTKAEPPDSPCATHPKWSAGLNIDFSCLPYRRFELLRWKPWQALVEVPVKSGSPMLCGTVYDRGIPIRVCTRG
jgi:hypothetical protein